jgi:aspartyl-tRNA(Asn)/glutamyl-tRNA(Gln) amidotransferase subunit B
MIETLTTEYGLTTKDAGTLLSLDDGHRLDYFFDVLSQLQAFNLPGVDQAQLGKVTGNW